jgi:hypothetical protein
MFPSKCCPLLDVFPKLDTSADESSDLSNICALWQHYISSHNTFCGGTHTLGHTSIAATHELVDVLLCMHFVLWLSSAMCFRAAQHMCCMQVVCAQYATL